MIVIKTTNAVRTLGKLRISLDRNQLAKAESRAINRSLEKGRTQARKEVKDVYNIPTRYLKRIHIHTAKPSKLEGDIYAETTPLPLDAFSPKQETSGTNISISRKGSLRVKQLRRIRKSPQGGVSIQVEKGKPREVIPYAFMLPSGKARVFARGEYKNGTQYGFIQRHKRVNKGGNDTPIKPLITMSVFGQVLNKKVMQRIERDVKAFYPERLEHEILFIMRDVGN